MILGQIREIPLFGVSFFANPLYYTKFGPVSVKPLPWQTSLSQVVSSIPRVAKVGRLYYKLLKVEVDSRTKFDHQGQMDREKRVQQQRVTPTNVR